MQKSLVLVVLWENKGERTVFSEGKCINKEGSSSGRQAVKYDGHPCSPVSVSPPFLGTEEDDSFPLSSSSALPMSFCDQCNMSRSSSGKKHFRTHPPATATSSFQMVTTPSACEGDMGQVPPQNSIDTQQEQEIHFCCVQPLRSWRGLILQCNRPVITNNLNEATIRSTNNID